MQTQYHGPWQTSAAEPTNPTPNLGKLMYSKREAAEMLSLSVRTIEYLIAAKELISRKVGKRVLISHQALLHFTRQSHETGRSQ